MLVYAPQSRQLEPKRPGNAFLNLASRLRVQVVSVLHSNEPAMLHTAFKRYGGSLKHLSILQDLLQMLGSDLVFLASFPDMSQTFCYKLKFTSI